MKALQNKNCVYVIKTLLQISTVQLGINSFSNQNEISILSQLSENLRICKEYYNSIYHNVASCFQQYLTRLPDLFVGKIEDDINKNLISNIHLKNKQDPAEIFKKIDAFFFIHLVDFVLLKNLPLFVENLLHSLLKLTIFSHRLSYMNFSIKKLMLMG